MVDVPDANRFPKASPIRVRRFELPVHQEAVRTSVAEAAGEQADAETGSCAGGTNDPHPHRRTDCQAVWLEGVEVAYRASVPELGRQQLGCDTKVVAELAGAGLRGIVAPVLM